MSIRSYILLLLLVGLAGGTARRPLVVVNGGIQQAQTVDYMSVGGVSTNGSAAGSGDVQTSTETVTSSFIDQGQFTTAGTLTVATWTTGQTLSDWAPTGLSTAYFISVEQSSGTTNINGIAAQPTGTEIVLYCRESSVGSIVLQYETGTTANQIVLPGGASFGFPWKLTPGSSVKLRYGGSNWQFVSSGTTFYPYLNVQFGANLGVSAQIGALLYTSQADTSTGTTNNFVLNSNSTTLLWSGASAATWTGVTGGSDGRILLIVNSSAGQTLTLSNINGGSLGPRQFQNIGDTDVTLVGAGSFATYVYDGTPSNVWRMTSYGSPSNNVAMTFTSSKNKGTITLAGGTGTATVKSGAGCTCTDTTATAVVRCAVSTTTLTATGTGTDVIQYLCF